MQFGASGDNTFKIKANDLGPKSINLFWRLHVEEFMEILLCPKVVVQSVGVEAARTFYPACILFRIKCGGDILEKFYEESVDSAEELS